MNDIIYSEPPAIIQRAPINRSNAVREAILTIHSSVAHASMEIADLLSEARTAEYYRDWGFGKFGDFTQQVLDMSERQAFYLIKIVTVSAKLNIDRAKLEAAQISKLKEIFTLDPAGFYIDKVTDASEPLDAHIVRLVDNCTLLSLDAIREEVKRLKGIAPSEELTWCNFQVTREVKDETVVPTLEMVKEECGEVTGKDGEAHDVSDGFSLQMLCLYYASAMKEERMERIKAEYKAIEVPTEEGPSPSQVEKGA